MKIGELAEVKQGLSIPKQLLIEQQKPGMIYFPVLRAEDFSESKSFFVYQKEFKNIAGFSRKSFLNYGDYILYKKGEDFKIVRYQDINKNTVAGDGLIVFTINVGILKDFFSVEKNRNRFYCELKKIQREEEGNLPISKIRDIEIWTDNIMELEEPTVAEEIGIRQPIELSDLPFNIVQKPLPMDKILKRIENNELLLDTEFQRKPGLWNVGTKSRFIESMIIRLPVPAFYFDGSNDNQWLVIDGLQRISAVNDFVRNKFLLTDLVFLPKELEGKSFKELERPNQRNIEEFEIFAYIILKGTPQKVKYKIFKNINTSALVLEPQEIRHALNPGPPAELLKTISEKDWFINGFKELLTPSKVDRMEDRELVLRFIAFQETRYTEYTPNIVDFLDNAMIHLYDIPSVKRILYEKEMQNIFSIISATLGEKAFCRSLFDSTKSYPLNTIMYELITYSISLIPGEKRNKLLQQKNLFKQSASDYFAQKKTDFWEYENAYTKENLIKRFQEIEELTKNITQ